MKATLALFDFDGTLTTKDSYLAFLQYSLGWPKLILKGFLLMPVILLYKVGILTNDKAKEAITIFFYKGWSANKFEEVSRGFVDKVIDKILRKEIMDKLTMHKNLGHHVLVVSASFEDYLMPWCVRENIDLIATQLEVLDGKMTGKFKSGNCHGIRKIERIKQFLDVAQMNYIYAYGDSKGDLPMLNLANEAYVIKGTTMKPYSQEV